jgi:general secretion pathway protein F
MLRAGLALDNALRVLIEMSAKPSVQPAAEGVLEDVKGGAPFSRALAKRGAICLATSTSTWCAPARPAARCRQVLERLVAHMERLRALRESVVSATMYPAILLGVAVLSLVGMLGFVVPQFERLFTDMGDALPLPTRIVMALGQGFPAARPAAGHRRAGAGLAGMRWLRSPGGRTWWQNGARCACRCWALCCYKYELTCSPARWAPCWATACRCSPACTSPPKPWATVELRQPLECQDGAHGQGRRPHGQCHGGHQVFEPLAINLVRVGEETGRIGPMMLELSEVLDREVETGIKRAAHAAGAHPDPGAGRADRRHHRLHPAGHPVDQRFGCSVGGEGENADIKNKQ